VKEVKEKRLIESEPPIEIEELEKGKIRDFATGKLVNDEPEEKVRQLFEKRLVVEYGYSKDQIDIEFMIQKGSQKIGPADIVVFRDEKKRFDNLYIIVETKRKERRDGLDQLRSYLSPSSAEFGVWFNGKEIAYLQSLKKAPYFRDIPDIPKKGETLEDVGLYQKKDLKAATELKTIFETCHNYIYANEGLLKEKVFNEVLKIIFIKMVDEKGASPKCEFRITDKEMTEIEEGKSNAFIGRIQGLFERVKREYSDVFDQNERINLKPITIAFVVSQLQKYSLIDTPADVKGTAFQTFVYAHERGERGEFFTPYPILELAVNMLVPKDDEAILDPACGSGGFLIQSMKHVWDMIDAQRPNLSEKVRSDMKIRYARVYIKGIDINPDLAKVSKMHMILYDDGHTGIFSANSLESFKRTNEIALRTGAGNIQPESFEIVMTNPPFGTKGKVTDKTILEQYSLGYKWKRNKKTGEWLKTNEILDGQTPEILFIERCFNFLRNGGRMAIVLPDGILNNLTLGYVRKFIQDKARILAVVSLPQETFIPHGTGSKASVVFLQKFDDGTLKELKKRDYAIFMAVCEKIGYDIRGRVLFKRNEKGLLVNEEGEIVADKESAAVESDIPEIITAFADFKAKYKLGSSD
jgi:type I restriction enzyme M protein